MRCRGTASSGRRPVAFGPFQRSADGRPWPLGSSRNFCLARPTAEPTHAGRRPAWVGTAAGRGAVAAGRRAVASEAVASYAYEATAS